MSDEHKRNISKALKGNKHLLGHKHSEETKRKISTLMSGERHPLFGKKHTEETKEKMSKTHLSLGLEGSKHSRWCGGKSFEPYCFQFNKKLKEKIRNRDERKCQLCGKSEILNGARLSIHHIDGDKMQGCDGKQWALVALCKSCNSKSDTIEKEFLIVSKMR
jgi:hypothetical protein